MKKTILFSVLGLAVSFGVSAQTKQSMQATQMATATALSAQSASFIQTPPQTVQTISGYYQQGFEGTTFAPAGWRVDNTAGPTYTWARSTAQAHNSTASAFIRYDVAGGQDWLIAPRYLVTATTDSVVFWMRLAFVGYQPDSLCIKVSTTDSLLSSFTTTLLHLREGTNYPPNTTTWYRYAVSLQNYVGQQVYVAFKHYDIDGDGLYIDDVSMGTVPSTDVRPYALVTQNPVGAGNVLPQASFTNNGTATQTFNVTAEINPGGYTSTTTINALAYNATATATFANWAATPGTYTMRVYSQLAGDQNMTNDTLTFTLNVVPAFVQYGWDNPTPITSGRWATGPVFVKECVGGTDSGYVYLIAGADASFANTTLNLRYNTVTGAYATMAPIPSARSQVSPIYVNGKIYVFGGYAGSFSPVNTTSIYDVATNTWSTGANMGQAVGDYAIGLYNDSLIYVIGGYTGSADVNFVQIYNVNTNTWMNGTPKPAPAVAGCRMGISGNKIVFVGGYSQTLAATQSIAILGTISPTNPQTIAWTTLPNYPAGPAGRHAAGVPLQDNGLVYFAGGDPNGQGLQVMNAVYAYNTITSQWEIGPNMPAGVSNICTLAGATDNDSLFMVTMGGYDGAVVTMSHSWLNIGPVDPLPYAQNDTIICDGAIPVMIQAFGGSDYSWTPAATLNNPNIANPMASPVVTTTYTVNMGKGYGCPVTDMVTVNVLPNPIVGLTVSANVVCEGAPVTLAGTGAVTYAWTGGVTDNVPFNPTLTDTYTVTGTDANGCSDTSAITITVNALPTITATSSASAVCAGDSVMLNGSGGVTYVWSGGVTDSVMFVPATTDTYTVTGIDVNGCTDTTTIMVTVNALPAVTANASAIAVCPGDSTTLTGGGAVSYTWTGSVTDNVPFVPATSDTYTVTGTDANGCMNWDSITVTVNPLPSVVANSSTAAICAGGFVTLTGSGAVSYTWTGSVIDNTPFQPTTTDSYTVTGIDANGCSNTDSVSVTVNPLPTVSATLTQTVICTDDANLALTGGSPSGGTWAGPGVSGNSFDPSIGVGPQTLTYSYMDANGCSDDATATITVSACVGVAEIDATGMSIYPNPNEGLFTITLGSALVSAQVEVTNELGQVVNAFTMTGTTQQVDISTLDNGVYFVRVINGENVTVQRVVKH